MKKIILFFLIFPLFLFSQDWNQIGGDIDGLAAGDWTGSTVATNDNGNIVVIGEHHSDYYNGRVRVFQKNANNSWIQLGQSLYGDGQGSSGYQGEQFGMKVSLNSDGTILAIAAPTHDVMLGSVVLGEYVGQVKIYQLIDNVWTQIGDTINGEVDYQVAGYGGVELNNSGNRLAISSNDKIEVYEYLQGSWTLLGNEINLVENSGYGASISMNGDGNKIGFIDYYATTAYIYEYLNNSWVEIANFQFYEWSNQINAKVLLIS